MSEAGPREHPARIDGNAMERHNRRVPKGRKRPMGILLVDDSEDDILLVEEALHQAPHLVLVHVARSGEDALAYLRGWDEARSAKRPDLVLLDLNMPVKNGFEVLEEMKADPSLRSIPVIVLTVSDQEDDVIRAYAGGACSYIRKPSDFDAFLRCLEDFQRYWTTVAQVPRHG